MAMATRQVLVLAECVVGPPMPDIQQLGVLVVRGRHEGNRVQGNGMMSCRRS
jgi:hypothetical protein